MKDKFEDAKNNKVNRIQAQPNSSGQKSMGDDMNSQVNPSKDEKCVSQNSDYIDENFELDETDELWGLNKQNYENLKMLKPKQNNIQLIDQN